MDDSRITKYLSVAAVCEQAGRPYVAGLLEEATKLILSLATAKGDASDSGCTDGRLPMKLRIAAETYRQMGSLKIADVLDDAADSIDTQPGCKTDEQSNICQTGQDSPMQGKDGVDYGN